MHTTDQSDGQEARTVEDITQNKNKSFIMKEE